MQLKVSTYFKNRDVEVGFTGTSFISPNIAKGAIGVLLLLGLLSWAGAKILSIQTSEKDTSIISPKKIVSESSSTKLETPETKVREADNVESPTPVFTDTPELKEIEEEAKPVEPIMNYMRVTVNLANVRQEPLLESNIIAMLWQGFIVRKIDQNEDWIYSDTGRGLTGWVHKDLLENTNKEDYQLWKTSRDKSTVIGLIKNNLDNHESLEKEKNLIKNLLRSWKIAWEKKDIDSYISFYSKAFTKSNHNWNSYKNYKKSIFDKPGVISIEIKDIQVRWENQFMVATFTQEYRSGFINSNTTKIARFQFEEDGWKIVKEFVVRRKLDNPTSI